MSTVDQFRDITGTSLQVAEGYLGMCDGALESAIQLFFENPDLQHNFAAAASSSSRPVRQPSRPTAGRQDSEGVIHLDDSDDADFDDMDEDADDFNDDISEDGHAEATRIAAEAQAAEDAAMAKRLQEELYSENRGGEEVRAPIASRTETLVGGWSEHDDGNAQMDFIAEMERRRRARIAASANPFANSIWNQAEAEATRDPETGQAASRSQRLADLFRPPFDMMARLSWEDAREEGKDGKKWILVNLQDMNIFQCQALNRDIWRDKAIKDLVKEHFIFLQYSRDDTSEVSDQYIQFYFPSRQHENSEIYPHVSIIDPRTGEQVKVWSGVNFPSAPEFMSQLVEFLDRYSLSANSKNPVAKIANRTTAPDIDRMTEEEMLEMALKNSMSGGPSGESSVPAVVDPDALTKLETPTPEETEFSKIASDRPHEEPAANAPNTTRIQFRHANGRVIRRFTLDDKVERIFEWLKAEPLQGNEAEAEFELKKMPAGGDLLELREQTIVEAGLKLGTVMIEYM